VARPWVAERARGDVLDLFCGVGGFALSVAARGRAGAVAGVDENAEAIGFARANAAANGFEHARFEAGDAAKFLDAYPHETLIVDPPRAGLGFSAVRRIVERAPPRVLYVSCNPAVLAQELQQFRGYEVEDLTGFDLFPKTPHVEVVATLARR
jgi:tRNA/tmRNA/rRNA uracil-C5-methylase (TrmA/RlmC/RlmD family)